MNFANENTPNAALLTMALRSLGYDNLSAINDIIDNSLDAEASFVKILIEKNPKDSKDITIYIIDNGLGMKMAILDQALRLGSEVDRDITSELGKFGMGLSTASMSIGKRVEVLTKTKESDVILKSISDVDEVIKANQFVKYLSQADSADQALFHKLLPNEESGTIIAIKKCDFLKNKNISQFKNSLRNEISRVFREFLHAGKQIYINGEAAEANDPLMLNHEETELFSDETYEIKYTDKEGKERKETIRMRLAIIPDFGHEMNKKHKINQANSGFYIMRNNREIANALTLGMFTKHNQYNRLRGELMFNANIDELMGVNFTKKNLDIDQSVKDKIVGDVTSQLRIIANKIKKAKVSSDAESVDHSVSEKFISQKTPLLLTPKATPAPKVPKDDENKKEKDDTKKKDDDKEKKPKKPEQKVKFEAESYGKNGPIYETYMAGKTVNISWNIDHPFYERFVLGTKEDKTLSTSIDFLIYSLATAEIQTLNDDNYQMIENLKNIMSMNLSTLLK